jgi:hypothetical protein
MTVIPAAWTAVAEHVCAIHSAGDRRMDSSADQQLYWQGTQGSAMQDTLLLHCTMNQQAAACKGNSQVASV